MYQWDNVTISPEFSDLGVDCYRLNNPEFLNEYYIVSEAETRKLLNTPEVVGYEVYKSLIAATSQMMYHLKEQKRVTSANILSILRGALNYPLEESCYIEHIRVHDISFLSCERTFDIEGNPNGLDVKYSKLAVVPGSTLLIGDIIASGDTLVHCLKYMLDRYRAENAELRNIVIFTIGGKKGIEITERMTREIREYWPKFEGFVVVYYEGVFSCYDEGDKGVSGLNIPNIDFIWRGGIVAPAYRRETLSKRNTLFEKCTIYDGGARRYEISEHINEVIEFWERLRDRSDFIDFKALLEEKLGHSADIGYEEWVRSNHYDRLNPSLCRFLFNQEKGYIQSLEGITLKEIAEERLSEFRTALKKYILN